MQVVAGPGGTLVGMIDEVVELGPGYRAVTRSRSTAVSSTSTTVILPLAQGGCVLRHSTDMTVNADTADDVLEQTQVHTRRYLARIRELAETSERHRPNQR